MLSKKRHHVSLPVGVMGRVWNEENVTSGIGFNFVRKLAQERVVHDLVPPLLMVARGCGRHGCASSFLVRTRVTPGHYGPFRGRQCWLYVLQNVRLFRRSKRPPRQGSGLGRSAPSASRPVPSLKMECPLTSPPDNPDGPDSSRDRASRDNDPGDSTIHRPEPTTSNASGLPRSPGA